MISMFTSRYGRVTIEDGIGDIFRVSEVLVLMFEVKDLLGGLFFLMMAVRIRSGVSRWASVFARR